MGQGLGIGIMGQGVGDTGHGLKRRVMGNVLKTKIKKRLWTH
jgi:hypothetical protein